MNNLKVGHFTNEEHGTGVSVFLFDEPARAVYSLCGSSPASRELQTLELDANVTHIDGLVLSGGSAFGLGAADGVMQWFKEQNRGVKTPFAIVPIVPQAALFDLGQKTSLPPTAAEAYQACKIATKNNYATGRIGAGTGATVGKIIPGTSRMTGGLGCAEITLPNGVSVLAYAAVNCVGDVYADKKIIAGACDEKNKFADAMQFLLRGGEAINLSNANTTLVAIFTNAAFSKVELNRISKIAMAGISNAIAPVFTRYDGDIIFCVSLGEKTAEEMVVGAMAMEAIRQAIVSAVKNSVRV